MSLLSLTVLIRLGHNLYEQTDDYMDDFAYIIRYLLLQIAHNVAYISIPLDKLLSV